MVMGPTCLALLIAAQASWACGGPPCPGLMACGLGCPVGLGVPGGPGPMGPGPVVPPGHIVPMGPPCSSFLPHAPCPCNQQPITIPVRYVALPVRAFKVVSINNGGQRSTCQPGNVPACQYIYPHCNCANGGSPVDNGSQGQTNMGYQMRENIQNADRSYSTAYQASKFSAPQQAGQPSTAMQNGYQIQSPVYQQSPSQAAPTSVQEKPCYQLPCTPTQLDCCRCLIVKCPTDSDSASYLPSSPVPSRPTVIPLCPQCDSCDGYYPVAGGDLSTVVCDRNGDGVPDLCPVPGDRNGDGIPDCPVPGDRNGDGIPDCPVPGDRNGDGIPDSPVPGDRNGDGIPDCPVPGDRNGDGIPDSPVPGDHNGDGVPDNQTPTPPNTPLCLKHYVVRTLRPVYDECIQNVPVIQKVVRQEPVTTVKTVSCVKRKVCNKPEQYICHVPVVEKCKVSDFQYKTKMVPCKKTRIVPTVQTYVVNVPVTEKVDEPLYKDVVKHVARVCCRVKPVVHEKLVQIPVETRCYRPVVEQRVISVPVKSCVRRDLVEQRVEKAYGPCSVCCPCCPSCQP